MPVKIDPQDGFVEFEFVGLDAPVRVDVYHAHETFRLVQRAYLKGLEDEGRQAEADMAEVMKRWAVKFFGKVPGLDPASWSLAGCTAVLDGVLEALAGEKKDEPGSSTPD